jgi:DNA-binding CsgD family transcriptional regulator
VLRLLDARLSTEEIAEVLDISPATVRGHMSSISRKLGLRGQGAAIDGAHGFRLLPS